MEQGQNQGNETNRPDRVGFDRSVWPGIDQHVDGLGGRMTDRTAEGSGPVGGGGRARWRTAGFLHDPRRLRH